MLKSSIIENQAIIFESFVICKCFLLCFLLWRVSLLGAGVVG